MPYGMKNGDTPESDKFMEGCVQKVMQSGKKMDKSHAVAICKSSYEKSKKNPARAEFIIDEILYGKLNTTTK